MKLPGIDRSEKCRKLRADEQTHSIPVIMISAFEDMSKEAIEAGADDFFSKPSTMEEVFIRVRSAFRIRHLTNELDRAVAYIQELEKNLPNL